jgi:hypothetical protein
MPPLMAAAIGATFCRPVAMALRDVLKPVSAYSQHKRCVFGLDK